MVIHSFGDLFFSTMYLLPLPAKPAPWPDPVASPLCTLAAPPGPAVVMRGQRDRQLGFTHGAGGKGHEEEAKGTQA